MDSALCDEAGRCCCCCGAWIDEGEEAPARPPRISVGELKPDDLAAATPGDVAATLALDDGLEAEADREEFAMVPDDFSVGPLRNRDNA